MGWKLLARGVALAAAVSAGGCAFQSVGAPWLGYRFFTPPEAGDPWSGKIRGWQARERAVGDTEALASAPASVSEGGSQAGERPEAGDLRAKYFAFRREQKRELAAQTAAWIQREARGHYRPDGPIDHWATLRETLDRDGEDCDGLELLVYHLLRDMGFRDDEVTRAIVVRPSDGQHHMVTLWFESRDDPWVIDPTGAMTSGMPRLSEVPGWVPLKLFTETADFSPRPIAAAH
jgi:predicted transglutaminase-like cysteine proteinase